VQKKGILMINSLCSLFHLSQPVRWRNLHSTVAAVVVLGSLLPVRVSSVKADGQPAFLPPVANYLGWSNSEWSAAWWQWVLSMPADQNPILDTADASAGQSGKVWFLGGTFGGIEDPPGLISGEADRSTTIPTGTALFFPLINVECSTLDLPEAGEEDLSACAALFADFIDPSSLFAEIDGKSISNVEAFRVVSQTFEIGPLPDNNILGATPGAIADAVSDGFYLMLPPLSVGEHTLQFGGAADLGGLVFSQDITYHITVTPRQFSRPEPTRRPSR
jgi:hypothetical protein